MEGADISEEALKVAKRNSEEILENNDVNNDAVSSRTEQIQNCTNLTNNQNKQDNSEDRMISEVRTVPQTGVTFRRRDRTIQRDRLQSTLHPQRCYRGAGTGSTGP